MEKEMFDKEHEEWLWEQVLADGPPQSDDLLWVKLETMRLWLGEAAKRYPDGLERDDRLLTIPSDEDRYFQSVWNNVESRLEEI